VTRRPLPPTAAVISFIDCINRGDVDGLGALMSDDHCLTVLDEAPVVGRAANLEAWRGYFSSFPTYVIYPSSVTETDGTVAVVGTTTGSHLDLRDEEERKIRVIWVAEVVDGSVVSWRIAEAPAE
jgi:ketosteroid isomerase-like protein